MHCCGKGLRVEPVGPWHIFLTQMRVKDGNKTVLTTHPAKDGEVLRKPEGGIFVRSITPEKRGAMSPLTLSKLAENARIVRQCCIRKRLIRW